MTKIYSILLAFITVATISSCTTEDPGQGEPISLELAIKDNSGNAVEGANVRLYESKADWDNNTNQYGPTVKSNAAGKVKFLNLTGNLNYYWVAEKNCENNINGKYWATTSKLSNTMDVPLSSTGTLKYVCSSDDTFVISINSKVAFMMSGSGTKYVGYKPAGPYDIRVQQTSGTLSKKNYHVDLNCGDTLTTVFP